MKRLFLFIGLVVCVHSALAQDGWQLDKAHASVIFSVKHMVISEVTGSFKDFNVSLKSTKDDFSDASVEGTIQVASINTDNSMRDGHLKSDDFFNAEKYPQIKFKSSSFEKTGDGKYKIIGDLTIRDVTKKATFDATLIGVIHMGAETHAGWKVTTTINRFDYNLKWNKTLETGGLIVGQDVTITLNLEFKK